MKIKNLYLVVIILLLVIIYFSLPSKIILEKKDYTNEIKIFNMDLEEYIIGVVAAEMPASFNIEALKAQAIAARTYAVKSISDNKSLTKDESTQSFIEIEDMKNKWGVDYELYHTKIKNAVYDTKGLVLKNNGEVITAFYFAISNGYTANSSAVFSEELNYIKSTESPWDKNVKNYEVKTTFSKDKFCDLLKIKCADIIINDIKYSNINQVENITVNNKIFEGTEFRRLLNLRSTTFTVNISENIIITTKGYGHGVGMSQYGANEMAKMGNTYEEILNYYYKDIKINKI